MREKLIVLNPIQIDKLAQLDRVTALNEINVKGYAYSEQGKTGKKVVELNPYGLRRLGFALFEDCEALGVKAEAEMVCNKKKTEIPDVFMKAFMP